MIDNTSGLWSNLALFTTAGILILVFGIRMTRVAAQLANRTRLGEAILGALFVGASTSLPEIATSLTAAFDGHANLAFSNAIGSVAGQTTFLALADMAYRRANLEHAAASAENLMLAAFVIIMLTIPLLGTATPQITIGIVHPVSIFMVVTYIYGIRLVSRTHTNPMWQPRYTSETRIIGSNDDIVDTTIPLSLLWLRFALAAAVTAIAGFLLARTAVPIATYTGLSETLFGGLFTGLTSSLPELISALTAVRLGSLTLAVGSVLGGNAFDTVIVAFCDWAYTGGSIFSAAGGHQVYLLSLGILLTAILMSGLVYREKHGIGNIGMESFLILSIYTGAFILLFMMG
jgi:cation:H+ antiporter